MTALGTSDLDVFPLSFGGNVFGWTADRDTSFAVLDAFVAGGGDFVDSADVYSAWAPGNSGGESETIIGEWLASRRPDGVVVATKVSKHPDFPGLSASNVRAGAEASLRRLGVEAIDLYYAHAEDPDTPLEETVAAFGALVADGLIRYPAISNFSAENTREWVRIARELGVAEPVAVQPRYNLVDRTIERDLVPVADELGLSLAQLAVAWVLQNRNVAAAIIGASRPEQVTENVKASGVTVPAELLARIDAILGDSVVSDPAETAKNAPPAR